VSESRVAVPIQASNSHPMSFQAFAATLRPQPIRNTQTGRVIGITAGQPNEIWLKHLGRLHKQEKHTAEQWTALIEQYGKESAYP
jgi:hypothetical protein